MNLTEKELETICNLYYELRTSEKSSAGFIHSKEKGFEEGYNSERDNINKLIKSVKELGLESYPFFKEYVRHLEEAYNLN